MQMRAVALLGAWDPDLLLRSYVAICKSMEDLRRRQQHTQSH